MSKTDIVHPKGTHEYTHMPMGFIIAPLKFIRGTDTIIAELAVTILFRGFIDDLLLGG